MSTLSPRLFLRSACQNNTKSLAENPKLLYNISCVYRRLRSVLCGTRLTILCPALRQQCWVVHRHVLEFSGFILPYLRGLCKRDFLRHMEINIQKCCFFLPRPAGQTLSPVLQPMRSLYAEDFHSGPFSLWNGLSSHPREGEFFPVFRQPGSIPVCKASVKGLKSREFPLRTPLRHGLQ